LSTTASAAKPPKNDSKAFGSLRKRELGLAMNAMVGKYQLTSLLVRGQNNLLNNIQEALATVSHVKFALWCILSVKSRRRI
jgi:hypothetical protein